MHREAHQAVHNGDFERLRELSLVVAPHLFDENGDAVCIAPLRDPASRQASIDLITRLSGQVGDSLRQHAAVYT